MGIYDYSVPEVGGGEFSLAENKGKVMLIVNTATGCGFTPQYEDLERIYEAYHDKGLEIIDSLPDRHRERMKRFMRSVRSITTRSFHSGRSRM